MKKLYLFPIIISASTSLLNIGTLTNNSSVQVSVIMYNNYYAPTETSSAKGRLNLKQL